MAEVASGFETLRRIVANVLRGTEATAVPEADFAEIGLALAERHRVVPLLAAGAPSILRERLRRRMLALTQQTVRLEQELASVVGLLSGAGVEFLVLKGPAMARQAYAVPESRTYDDLDLWVAARDAAAVVRALEAGGYRRAPPLDARSAACARRAGIETALVHPEHGRLVEVAHGFGALAPTARAAREMLAAAVELEVADAKIRTPAPMHALLMACVHGAHHRWDRLGWVVDVAGLWQRLSPAEQAEACAIARRWRIAAMLGLGLRLAVEHLGVALGDAAAALAFAPRVDALLACVALAAIGHESPRTPMIARLRFERDAQDSTWRRFRMMAGWIFTPTLGDIAAVPLPAALSPLYAVIRPLRLLRHPWLRDWRTLAGHG